jgi:hypothetical protein
VRTHITNSGAFPAKTLRDNQRLQTLDPRTTLTVNVDKDSGRPLITIVGPDADNTANVIDPRNIRACKSFIHAINEAFTACLPTIHTACLPLPANHTHTLCVVSVMLAFTLCSYTQTRTSRSSS